MKNLQLLLMVLVIVAFASCKKNDVPNTTTASKYVKSIAASYKVQEGDIKFKDAPVGTTRTFILYHCYPTKMQLRSFCNVIT